ncbi:MAG: hypothetical protein R3B09_23710 [Nannocystaceae bacterium]
MKFHLSLPLLCAIALLGACSDDTTGDPTTAGSTSTTDATDSTTDATTDPDTTPTTSDTATTATTSDTDGSESDTDTETTGEPEDAVTRVVYRAVVEAPDVVEIFAVDVSDGVADPPAKVSAELAAGEVIGGQLRSTDRWLVYGGFSPDTSSSELYVVDLRAPTPGAAFRVTDAPVPALGTVVGDIEFSPDGSLLAFSHHGPSAGVNVYLVPVDGDEPGTAARLNPEAAVDSGVIFDAFSPDGDRVLYTGSIDDGVDNVYLQYADIADPGPPVLVSDNQSPDVAIASARWIDGDWIEYRADVDDDGIGEVFVVDVSGAPGEPIALDMGDAGMVRAAGMAPDLRGYAYWVGDGVFGDLYVAPFDGVSFGPPALVNTIGAGGDVYAKDAYWSPDSSWLVYVAAHNTPGILELFAVDMEGVDPGAPQQVNGPLSPDGEAGNPRFSPTGSHLYYFATQDSAALELYRVSVAPGVIGAFERVHQQTIHHSTSLRFFGEEQLVFVGSEGDDDELFIVDLNAAPLTAQRVNASHPGADVTFGYQHSADGRAIAYATAVPQGPQPIYLVDQDGDGLGVAVEVAADSELGPLAVRKLP